MIYHEAGHEMLAKTSFAPLQAATQPHGWLDWPISTVVFELSRRDKLDLTCATMTFLLAAFSLSRGKCCSEHYSIIL